MNFIFLPILLSFQINISASDDYIKYYNLGNEAQTLYDQKDFMGALVKIREAFKCVSYIHNEKLLLASKIAAGLQDNALVSFYLERGFAQGIKLETIIEDSIYTDFGNSSNYKKLVKRFDILRSAYLKQQNDDYSDAIDSLFYIDQFLLRSSTEKPKRIFNLTKEQCQAMNVNDSIVYFTLMSLVEKNGFPTERIVRRESLRGAYVIIHHFARMPGHEILLQKMKDLLTNGKFMPFYYAWAYDQSLMIGRQKPLYYCGVPYDKSKLTVTDLERINLERSKIGLESLTIAGEY